jgi:hypothetical protein
MTSPGRADTTLNGWRTESYQVTSHARSGPSRLDAIPGPSRQIPQMPSPSEAVEEKVRPNPRTTPPLSMLRSTRGTSARLETSLRGSRVSRRSLRSLLNQLNGSLALAPQPAEQCLLVEEHARYERASLRDGLVPRPPQGGARNQPSGVAGFETLAGARSSTS